MKVPVCTLHLLPLRPTDLWAMMRPLLKNPMRVTAYIALHPH